jgi:outer membrane protein
VQAQKAAISEQLAQAKRNFEVGTATITDTHEAQARFDLSAAQEIAAQSDLETKRRALQQITGKEYAVLRPLRPEVKLTAAQPGQHAGRGGHRGKAGLPGADPGVRTEIAGLEAKRNAAGHLPTAILVASYGTTVADRLYGVATAGSGVDHHRRGRPAVRAAALARARDQLARARDGALYSRSKQDLENARRSQALTARRPTCR